MQQPDVDHTSQIIQGDCEKVPARVPDNLVDLIFTSSPYADLGKNISNWLGQELV